jgi:hypothetical protein
MKGNAVVVSEEMRSLLAQWSECEFKETCTP